jgi:antitoxin YefM
VETAHLLRSPKNAQRLLAALQRARANRGMRKSLDRLKAEVGLGEE